MNSEKMIRADERIEDAEAQTRREDDLHHVTECGLTRAELRELVAEMIG